MSRSASRPTKQARALPKARVITAVDGGAGFRILEAGEKRLKMRSPHDTVPDYYSCACLPLSSPKQARQIVQLANLTSEQRVEQVTSGAKGAALKRYSGARVGLIEFGTFQAGYCEGALATLKAFGLDSPHTSGEQK